MSTNYDIIVLDARPAGLTAGVYVARARRRVVILDTGAVGGQTILTHAVANCPGVVEISGWRATGSVRRGPGSPSGDVDDPRADLG